MTRKQFVTTVYGVGFAALVSVPAFAQAPEQSKTTTQTPTTTTAPASTKKQSQHAHSSSSSMKYDAKTEVTLSGTIEDVQTVPAKNGAPASEYLMLKTESGHVKVGLAPSDYWSKNGFALAKGASIEVTGSKMQSSGSEVVLARVVKEGEKSVTLRNPEGAPAWAHHQHAK
jgi:hypothetical protein